MTEQPTLLQEIRQSLSQGQHDLVRRSLHDEHPADLGTLLGDAEPAEAHALFDLLDLPTQAQVASYLSPARQIQLVTYLDRPRLARLVTEMNADERADLYQNLPDPARAELLPALAQAEREDLRKLASYSEGTVGAVMTSEYATLPEDITAREAVERLRAQALSKETIYIAYVLDAQRRLLGTVTLAGLVIAPSFVKVEDLMHREPVTVHAGQPQAEAARLIADYDLLAVPVLDDIDTMVGIVTHDDAMDVAEAEATEDFHKGAMVSGPLGSLKDAKLVTLYHKRVPWLVLLVFGNLLSGFGIAYFEDTIAAYVVLVFFMPLLVGSAGNAGSQASTLMVRALATGDVYAKDWAWMLGREFAVAGALGLTMGLAVSGIGWFRGGPEIAAVVAMTMLVVVMTGSLIGMSLPFLLNRLGMDPATASAPLVTTIADVVGVLIYFGIATRILDLPPG
ncbi:MAG: magnesium transporter [Candidatus Competibacteraceae bacterium]|nr:MAG: magnesium transporter [Candidatus Competibacteraceae bacterium]